MRLLGEVLRNAMTWPGLEMPRNPTAHDIKTYSRTLHADPTYQQAAREFLEHQCQEPQPVSSHGGVQWWAYKDTILEVDSGIAYNTALLLVKHFMLKRSHSYDPIEKIRREVLENLEKLPRGKREPIPEAVRFSVWRRDEGQCVKCGSRQLLEFDHIIPITDGGSNTERNIQLLCESCNRAKGSTI
jgi:hypothetical protein